MSRFAPLLVEINKKLDLPQPTKSRILLEIAADLDDLYGVYRTRGLSEEEAQRKAEEKFSVTDDTLNELVKVHQSFFRRFLDKITEQAQSRWERVILVLVLLSVAALSAKAVLSIDLLQRAGGFVWPILGVVFVATFLSLRMFYGLYVKKDYNLRGLREGLSAMLFLCGSSLFLGALGYNIELWLANRFNLLVSNQVLALTTSTDPLRDPPVRQVVEWYMKSSYMMMCSLLASVFIATIWYVLACRVSKIEQAEAAFLLQGEE